MQGACCIPTDEARGLSSRRALDPATWLARGQPIEFGAVRVGLQADLLLVEGDPTEDIARLQDISEVIVAGTPLERSPGTTVASAAH